MARIRACVVLILAVHASSSVPEFQSEDAFLQGLEDPGIESAILSSSLQWMRTCVANSWWKAARAIVSRTHLQKPLDGESSGLAALSAEVRALIKDVKQQADQFAEYADATFRGHRQGLDDVPCALQWAQNSTTVFLAVKYASRWSAPGAIEITDVSVNVTDDTFVLAGFGHHSNIRKRYFVDLPLFADVVPSRSSWSAASVGRATATIHKAQAGKWSRLTRATDKSKHQITSWLDMEERWSEELKNRRPEAKSTEQPKAMGGFRHRFSFVDSFGLLNRLRVVLFLYTVCLVANGSFSMCQAKAETTSPAPPSREKGQRVHTPMYKKVQRQLHRQIKRLWKYLRRGAGLLNSRVGHHCG